MKKILLLLFALPAIVVHGQNASFSETASFYPNNEMLQRSNIVWGYLNVPENWEDAKSKTIKVAVAVLKNSSKKENANAVVFIQGGPGASGIQSIGMWLRHPLLENNDIVLFDVRGTGFSEPRLCPDLGKEFMEILSKDQGVDEDESQKTLAALRCKQNILDKGIDINAYHSLSISKDLDALRSLLGYDSWHVYGVSYGTYIAQVYASTFPGHVKTLTLDSFIADASTYYTRNTSNYMNALSKVFELCKGNSGCNANYPALEKVYYQTISELDKDPITVAVDKKILASGEFTYGAEDFKVAIQQALYNKQLVAIIPLLIYEFHHRNDEALGKLVAAFSSLLRMDYGVYYCMSCNEMLPNNEFTLYQKDALQYDSLMGGVSFYRSDFKVCDQWNNDRGDSSIQHFRIASFEDAPFPVLLFSGEYDPITPPSNAEAIVGTGKNIYLVNGRTLGHVPSFSRIGFDVAESFINDPGKIPDTNAFKDASEVRFASDVIINPGVSNAANSLNEKSFIFLSPLVIALIIMLVFILMSTVKFFRMSHKSILDKIMRGFVVLTSIIGIAGLITLVMALMSVANENQFILAFGLPGEFNYVFAIILTFVGSLVISLVFLISQVRRATGRRGVLLALFSNVLVVVYLFYWGIV